MEKGEVGHTTVTSRSLGAGKWHNQHERGAGVQAGVHAGVCVSVHVGVRVRYAVQVGVQVG